MKNKLLTTAQIFLGLMLIIFGVNKFLNFMPAPQPTVEMGHFIGALFQTGYLMILVAIIEIVAGISFVIGKFTALMALILLPVMLNAFLAHLFLDPAGIMPALIFTVLTLVVMLKHKTSYHTLLKS